jgi:hypothetical protein
MTEAMRSRPQFNKQHVDTHQRPAKSRRPVNVKALPRVAPEKAVGFGMTPNAAKLNAAAAKGEGLGSWADAVNDSKDCPVWNMDVIEQVRWTMEGPQTDQSVTKNFGAEIDLFGSGKSPQDIDYVETTMAQTGETQTHFITCYVGFHLEPEPLSFTASGNAWTHPVTGAVQPPSPNAFTENDIFNGALGVALAGGTPTQIMVPAIYRHGWWANYVAWHMVRAYNLRWKIGQHTNIMDEVLRHSAFMPPSAQEGSSGSSEVDIDLFVRDLNDRYDSMGSALDFLKINRTRYGSAFGTAGTNLGVFLPSRDQQTVGVTYGGIGLRGLLKGNSEFRKLALPYVIAPGVPIGLILQENDAVQATKMREYLSITNGFGGSIPPIVTDDENILDGYDGTNATPVGLERTVDGFNVAQSMPAGTAMFEGGELKLSLMIKGFEVTKQWYDVLSANPDLMTVVQQQCGIHFPT